VGAPLYEIPLERLSGEQVDLKPYRDHVLLVVNTASRCGFTPQYAELERLWRSHRERGLVVLGFPCNQFGKQEPGDAEAIQDFCQTNYGVSFPMFAKLEVNGPKEHPLFGALKHAARGFLGTRAIKWNFTKFVVGRRGSSVERFAPSTRFDRIEAAIERALAATEV